MIGVPLGPRATHQGHDPSNGMRQCGGSSHEGHQGFGPTRIHLCQNTGSTLSIPCTALIVFARAMYAWGECVARASFIARLFKLGGSVWRIIIHAWFSCAQCTRVRREWHAHHSSRFSPSRVVQSGTSYTQGGNKLCECAVPCAAASRESTS